MRFTDMHTFVNPSPILRSEYRSHVTQFIEILGKVMTDYLKSYV